MDHVGLMNYKKHSGRTAAIAADVHVLHEPQHVVVLNLGCVPILQNGSEPQLNSEAVGSGQIRRK